MSAKLEQVLRELDKRVDEVMKNKHDQLVKSFRAKGVPEENINACLIEYRLIYSERLFWGAAKIAEEEKAKVKPKQ